jgi:hypothetical protein
VLEDLRGRTEGEGYKAGHMKSQSHSKGNKSQLSGINLPDVNTAGIKTTNTKEEFVFFPSTPQIPLT